MKKTQIDLIAEQINRDHKWEKTAISEWEVIDQDADFPFPFEELKEKFNPQGLYDQIFRAVRTRDIQDFSFNIELRADGAKHDSRTTGIGVEIGSRPLRDNILGIFQSVFSEAEIVARNQYLKIENDVPILGLTLAMTWKHKDGGTNGAKMFDAWYNFETQRWTFE
jgi:hypothetical protein